MHFQVKMPENGRKKIFRDEQTTNKVQLIFLDVKVLTETEQFSIFGFYLETTKVECKKGQQWSERWKEERTMFL